MKISISKSLLAILTLWFVVSSGPSAYSQNLQVNFGVTFRNARLMPLWIADEEGYFKKQGLAVKYEDVVDTSIMDKLDKSGFIDTLYK
jgi:ABC-type nitrate/sulfonate/bicarbonate transport system substrate-binding protein